MSVQYLNNVQAMCDRLGISNPIQESDILISHLTFHSGGKSSLISGSALNRGGRLFFQEKFSGPGFQVKEVKIDDVFKKRASTHFAEYWNDAEEMKRNMICALKNTQRITIEWK